MRGAIDGLVMPYPIGEQLPAVYQEDPFAMRFTAGFDDVLAPVVATLDCLEAYIDPWLTPEDFLDWLAGWVGMVLDETWPLDRRRAVTAHAVELFRLRGTPAGLKEFVELFTGGEVQINETGGTNWSPTPGGELPGEPSPRLSVRVWVDDPESVSESALDALVTASKPAHVLHRVEVRARDAR
ncbi:MAG: phage tail protein [Acidimicrobiales bacterium]